MQQKILQILDRPEEEPTMSAITLSFRPFLNYVRAQIDKESGYRKDIFNNILLRFDAHPELEEPILPESLGNYKDLLDLLHIVLTSVALDEKNALWGLSIPMSPVIFYGSDPFYALMSEDSSDDIICKFEGEEHFIKQIYEHFYSFVLERFYGVQFRSQSELTRTLIDRNTNLSRHFKVSLDTRFVDVTATGELPKIDAEFIRSRVLSDDALNILHSILPPELFSFSGFSIVNIREVTNEYALEEIKNYVVTAQNEEGQTVFPGVVQALKELVGTNDIDFNILPLYRVNGKLVDDMHSYCQSIIFSLGNEEGLGRNVCGPMIEKFISNPKLIYFSDLDTSPPSQQQISRLFHIHGVKSYSLMPVYYHKKLVGALEMYSYKKAVLNENSFNAIQPAITLIAQLVKNSLSAFDDQLEAIIKEKFTPLQPSVQWKFNEVAWHYLQMKQDKNKKEEPQEIDFKNVYPLYGAVDIRNSTIERNAALTEDLKIQLTTLTRVLHNLKLVSGFGLLDEKIFLTQQWMTRIESASGFEQEIILNDFLDNDIRPFLEQFTVGNVDYLNITQEYFDAVDEEKGSAYENRRQLERSMGIVISSVNNYFDMLKGEIQHSYPCYFEKFRTDGVEYDIYIGQSIAPDKPYSDIYLQNLRLMQLRSMAAIANYSHSLSPQLSWPIQTTQLIFIHSHAIDIKFRRDEKRFDVEGAYNIRYHIIKKRIDKVRIKSSKERLTQPFKIALVYFSQSEADEYISYIHYLQQEKILNNDLEYLELEELQGVSGLKALRVGVTLEES